MGRWIALLRGVNVNGITVRSAELAQLFRDLGFAEVRTVLASGNVCFEAEIGDTEAERAALKARIEGGLRERFGYEAWIVLVPHDALAEIIAGYPFEQDGEHHAYAVFVSTEQAREELLAGAPSGGSDESDAIEQVAGGDGVVYWRAPRGASTDTPFSKHAGRARFKATTTTRNLNTLRKML